MVNSRQKGATFERDICRDLQLDLNIKGFVKRDIEQYRTADRGDILIEDDSFPYLIECKRYKSGNTYSDAWWQQVERAAENMKKEPVLVYKFDRQPVTVVMRLEHLMKDDALHEEKVRMDWEAFCYIARENWNDLRN
jgi:Holliday junction resolvase